MSAYPEEHPELANVRRDALISLGDTPQTDVAQVEYTRARVAHWDRVARSFDVERTWATAYHQRLAHVYRTLIAPGQRVLEIGCGRGDLLNAVEPSYGIGIDFSGDMIDRGSARYPHLQFIKADAHTLRLEERFDVVILSDLVNDLWDVQAVFRRLHRVTTPRSRVIMHFYSRVWEAPLQALRKLGLARPVLEQNWLTTQDVSTLLRLADFEFMRHWEEVLLPLELPAIASIANKYLARLWPLNIASLANFVVARQTPHPRPAQLEPTVSVIVPARNEAGNIANIFERTPEMGAGTELVFVEGHSTDNTAEVIEREMVRHPDRKSRMFRQTGRGKGDAVRLGFAGAGGDVLMILDADLTVAPEDLPRFVDALQAGTGEFINGVRLVYPMEKQAMRFFNFLGNKFFSLAFSWLLGQPVKDTLCGTKALWASDYQRIASQRAYFGDFDPFGDFDLLFGAARLNLKIVDLPIRYRERTYGTTNIQRWRHGQLLLRMVVFAARRIKFV
ncbi:MAG: glycosyltransferase [Chloroflexi bacterium]|nr:glycosyltransferase [Chloroflexota bacterium]